MQLGRSDEWMCWCRQVGWKLPDQSLSSKDVVRSFVKPTVVREHPPLELEPQRPMLNWLSLPTIVRQLASGENGLFRRW